MDQVIKDDTKLNSHEEIMEYVTNLVDIDEEIDMTKPLWEFRVIEDYTQDTSLIVYKIHHCFMDGIGFSSMMSAMSDNQFASKINKEFIVPPLLTRIKGALISVVILLTTLFTKGECFSDDSAVKIVEETNESKYPMRFYASKEYDFEKVTKRYKQFPDMTFNDFVISIFGKSCNQLYKEYGIENAKQLGIWILINLRPLPTKYEEICLDDLFIMCPFPMQLSDDIDTVYKSIKPPTNFMKTPETTYTLYCFSNLV